MDTFCEALFKLSDRVLMNTCMYVFKKSEQQFYSSNQIVISFKINRFTFNILVDSLSMQESR